MISFDKQKYDDFFIESKKQFLRYETERYVSLLQSYNQRKIEWNNKINCIENLKKEKASTYNIFELLNLSHREVTLHTPFLADLFNINGMHYQGNLFLNIFLSEVLNYDEKYSNDKRWIIKIEKENMDIRILNYELNEAIYIENKIYSSAHSGQISRYYKHWLQSYFRGSGKFIYLTIKGVKPNLEGFNKEYPATKIMADIECLSYTNDIIKFIELSLSSTSQPKIRTMLKQYKQIIERL